MDRPGCWREGLVWGRTDPFGRGRMGATGHANGPPTEGPSVEFQTLRNDYSFIVPPLAIQLSTTSPRTVIGTAPVSTIRSSNLRRS